MNQVNKQLLSYIAPIGMVLLISAWLVLGNNGLRFKEHVERQYQSTELHTTHSTRLPILLPKGQKEKPSKTEAKAPRPVPKP
jgi:hypothetical protein